MLVICYTNHALDQFLEALLPITNSIVRIGGQSRNEAMENINLTTLRRKTKLSHITNKMFYEQLNNLRYTVNELKRAQEVIDELNNGLISYDIIKEIVPESLFLREYYNNYRNDVKSDPLKHWLFENMNYVDFNTELLNEYPQPDNDLNNIDEDDVHERVDFILDDFSEEVDQNDYHRTMLLDHEIKSSFSIKEAQNKLINLLLLYNRTNNRQHQLKLQQEIVNTKSCIDLYVEMAANYNRDFPLVLDNRTNLMRVRPVDRWSFYFKWAKIVIDVLKKNMKPLQESLQSANYAYEEARMMVDLKLLKGVKVVGMTTSGAARLRKLLQALAPPIVIVEEAAEVLEQHIVTSLTKDCKHLVLIGDHQQLRPSASHMKLARHFNIEISLFERMITNGMHSQRLGVQHRMRPEIAALISPHIYPDLQNHPSVHHFPRVRGMSDNLFFLTHNYKEENVEDSSSRSNLLEADMTLGLANYLMQQGYESEDVTILSAYSGQMFYMRKQREKYAHLSKVKITVVDNYQGEESKIILLSLVRNNDQNKIGFLGTENRVCVALSRAREGFYIFGNIDILKKNSTLWTNIAATLETNNSIGTSIFLKCENHPDLISTISSPKDFEKVPEGGCLLKCNFNLPCGHKCPRACHGYDRSHVDTKCYLKCERFLCDLLHVCPLLCWVKCQPCMRLVEKSLPCGHKMLVHCHKDPKDPTVLCTTTVSVTLPLCGHEAKKPCYKKIETVQCAVRCIYRVDKCGHECMLNCHLNDDPDHEKYKCEKPCAKAKKGCSQAESLAGDRLDHQCPKRCYEDCDNCTVEVMKKRSACKHTERVACNLDVDKTLCRKNCARVLNCGHFCKLKCYQKCGECKQKVKKVIPDCNHNVEVMCMQEATRQLCKQPCEKLLPCGHRCMDRCNRPCDPDKCTVMITEKQFDSPCGHKVTLPCNVYNAMIKNEVEPERLLQYCSKRCTVELKCGHMCGGTCATCHQGRLHAACTQTCHQINICGHQCQEPCNQVCPPCKIPCEIKCPHSRCNKLCGEQCKPCQEKCARVCRHGACKNLCGEPCSRPPCDEPCAKRLRCGHACRGLCGEPCPRICKVCRPDDFPTTFLGDDYDDDERFVQLQDCPHVLDVENMDNLMTGDTESITIRACPFCRKPIINTYRYKDLVNKMFTTKINPIKWKVYGQEKEIRERKEELSLKVIKLNDTYGRVKEENSYWKLAYLKLSTKVKTQKKNVSLLKLEMQFQYLNILEMIAEYYEKYTVANLTLLKREFFDLVKVLCRLLNVSAEKISQQQQEDIGNELKRMNAIIQFSKILSHSAYLSTKAVPKVATATDMAKQAVLSWHKFDDKEARTALMRLQEEVKVSGVVTREERELVVRAVGLKAGHWYKCPQGHFYCIGECGGAMEVARCPECGSRIGGSGHRLLADNAHAPEMDGSRFAAWSEEFNNMANFNFE